MNKRFASIVRIIFGLLLIFGGAMVFFTTPAIPEGYPAKAAAFLQAMFNTGYFTYFLGLVEIAVGLMFVTRRYVALGAILLAPFTVNVIVFHIFLDMKTIIPGLILLALNIFVAYTEKEKYRDVLKSR